VNRFKSVLQLQGFPIQKAENALLDIQAKISKEGYNFTIQKSWDIFNYHKDKNPCYNSFLKNKTIKQWTDIPVMSKNDLQIPLEKILSNGFSKTQVFVGKTSGSSGHPFVFAKDKFAHALTWAHIMHLYKQHGIKVGQSLEARFYGIPKDFKNHQKERLKDKIAKRSRFDIFDLSNQNLSKFIAAFRKNPFEYLNGYTSSMVMFAKFLKSQNLVLKTICPSLKICITTSEMLFENDRRLLEDVFGIPVVNEYGASEVGVIAFEDVAGNWVVNNQTMFVEIVDEKGQVLPYNKEGDLVITSLYNQAYPMIRYKIGDIGLLSQHNSKGHQVLKKLTGRTNVFAVLPSGKKVPALAFYYVTKSVIDDKGEVKELKVVQQTKNSFLIKYVAETELLNHQKKSIQSAVEKYLAPGLDLKFERIDKLQRTKSGKLRQFESNVCNDYIF